MEVKKDIINGIPVLAPIGDITMDSEIALEDAFLEIRTNIQDIFVMNMEKVRYVNSTGLKLLIRIIDNNKSSGVETRFCNVASSVLKVMDLVGLMDHAKFFSNLNEATEE